MADHRTSRGVQAEVGQHLGHGPDVLVRSRLVVAVAVRVVVQGANPGCLGAAYYGADCVARVDRLLRPRAEARKGELEEARVWLVDADRYTVKDGVLRTACARAVMSHRR